MMVCRKNKDEDMKKEQEKKEEGKEDEKNFPSPTTKQK